MHFVGVSIRMNPNWTIILSNSNHHLSYVDKKHNWKINYALLCCKFSHTHILIMFYIIKMSLVLNTTTPFLHPTLSTSHSLFLPFWKIKDGCVNSWKWHILRYLISSKISGFSLSRCFILSFIAVIILLALSSAPCFELFSAAPENQIPHFKLRFENLNKSCVSNELKPIK